MPVRRMFEEVVNLGKIDVIDDLWDPEFESVITQATLDLPAFKGFVAAWQAGFPDIHCVVADVISEGDRVAWSVRATGTFSHGRVHGPPAHRPLGRLRQPERRPVP